MQRSMLRRFAGPRRQADEEFIPWIRRSTRMATEKADSAGVNCWVADHLQAKWRWAGNLARLRDYRPDSWAVKTTFWRDAQWRLVFGQGEYRPLRARAGRWRRWEDEIHQAYQHVGGGTWTSLARYKDQWHDLADAFSERRF